MAYIEEIQKLPLFKTVLIILFVVFSLFPPIIFLYSLQPNLFMDMDLLKLLLLTGGFGLTYTSFNTFLTMVLIIVDPNYDEAHSLKNARPLILGLCITIFSYVILYILISLPNSFFLSIVNVKFAVLQLLICSLTFFCLLTLMLISDKNGEKKESK